MKRVTEYLLWIIVFVAISATAFYCGGNVGFSQGYNYAIAKDAPYDADTSVTVLKKIKDNKNDEVANYFEKQLDNPRETCPRGCRFQDRGGWRR